MSKENVEIVLDHFTATNERDFERAMGHYADDVVLVVPRRYPEAGTFRGRDAVGEWFGGWLGTFQPDYRFDIDEARDLGDGVLIVANHHGHGRASGAGVHERTAYVYRLHDGKITHVELDIDRAKALEAAGIEE
jgi:ketosteroid isomerase-like protein